MWTYLYIIFLKLLGPIFWLVQYKTIFHTNKLSKRVIDFHLLTPDQSPFTDRKMQLMEIKINFCMGTQKKQHKY